MKKELVMKLRGMHSHHVGAYFKLYHLCKENGIFQIYSENIAMHIASIFISPRVSMRDAKVQQEALALDVAFTALEKANLINYHIDSVVVHELYVNPISRNETLKGALDGAWDDWVEYKKDNKPYKTAKTEMIAYNQLMKAVKNNIDKAKHCIESAISSQWQGLHPDISLRRLKEAQENLNYMQPALKKINEIKAKQNDKIGRINREDLQQWIDSDGTDNAKG
jgi:hypothetical protein